MSNATAMSLTTDITGWTDEQVVALRAAVTEIATKSYVTPLPDSGDIDTTGWTAEAYYEAIKRLLSKHQVQVGAIFETVKTGNPFVSREAVYEIGSYPQGRSLRGFTRPVNRVQQELVDEGLLPDDAADLLETVYAPGASGYQRAVGFRVPLEVIKIAQEEGAKRGESRR
ncbi:hypothetical protein [Nocardioides sp. KR10-350]|uniref:hypothetical protein n=1 Tax=Nocardioides cheoyonin TaxID=3156615 RepID=UPI0032B36063